MLTLDRIELYWLITTVHWEDGQLFPVQYMIFIISRFQLYLQLYLIQMILK